MKKHLVTFLFFAILLLAALLRFWRIDVVPPGIDWDEAAVGYNAYSLLKTGKDEYGNPWPLTFTSFGDGKLPVIVYATVPSIAAFGLTPLGIRFPSILVGIGTVAVTYFLTLTIFKKKSIALTAMFLLAVSPWHLQFSRAAFEPTWATFFVPLSLFFWWKGKEHPRWYLAAAGGFALSLYTYHSVKIFLPLMLLVLLFLHRSFLLKNRRTVVLAGLVFFLLASPAIVTTFTSPQGRLAQTSVINHPSEIEKINARRRDDIRDGFPFPALWNNKLTRNTEVLAEHYASHFSPQFLFFGEQVNFRLGLRDYGKFHLFEAVLLLIGVYTLIRWRNAVSAFLFAWIGIGVLPGALGTEFPHSLRTLVSLPSWQMVGAVGAMELFGWVRKVRPPFTRLFVVFAAVIVLSSLFVYLHEYHVYFRAYGSFDWQDGHKDMAKFVYQNKDRYEKIVVTTRLFQPHIFYALYNQIDPAWYQRQMTMAENDAKKGIVQRLGNVFFQEVSESRLEGLPNTLVIASSDEIQSSVKRIATFPTNEGNVLFYAIETSR
ncbi:MAG: glycosyltransferase family 39 protein [bacterium]|nr:glycosyltransferase family 39 protein [bacterium]